MKIISFFNSDYNFSAKLARICDIELNELLFENDPKNIEKYKTSGPGFIIIDIDDYRECLKETVENIKNYIDYPIYGLISKMDRKIQKNAIEIGFDIIMTKSNFLYNIKTIKKQIINASRIS